MEVLKNQFGLTAAETRLVLRLVAGELLKSAAVSVGIGYETARKTLKTVFHKTRTCRQTELVIMAMHAIQASLKGPIEDLQRERP